LYQEKSGKPDFRKQLQKEVKVVPFKWKQQLVSVIKTGAADQIFGKPENAEKTCFP
jgi:hypothetical protein